ncbi:response regulator [Hansschlegelia sp. KR7-227]|uniref:response regulator n=1 Tax=Hansschlegelia sp. KR7-227 TaxID=3400914 RepID=UPI003C02097F
MSEFRVLILEDDAVIALDLETIVRCWTDATVTSCRSLKQARRALAGAYDLAFLDVDVADGKSYELAGDLKARSLPFAFVTGSDRRDAPAEFMDAAFISKPYDQRTIEKLVAAAGGGRRHP